MPIYQYRCGYCNHVFEDFRHTYRKQTTQCPKCKRIVTKENRVMSLTNFNAVNLRCQREFGHDMDTGIQTSEGHKA